jgi:electron transfer flavoprotein alpha subunit
MRNATLPTVSFAADAAEVIGGDVHVLVLGDDEAEIADEVASLEGVDQVWLGEHPALENYMAEYYTQAIEQVAEEVDAGIVTAAASAQGADFLPRVASQMESGMVTNCFDVWDDGEGVRFKRPMWSGGVWETVEVKTPTKLVSVRTTDYGEPGQSETPAPIDAVDVEIEQREDVEHVNLELVKSDRPELTDADVVISGGFGLGNEEAFEMLEDLADLFGGAVGASRAAVDSGFAPKDWQIGQTGKVVAPDLYVAIAISGAIQHLSGMKGSKNIVAINTDPDAPIFDVANYGLVQDAFEAVPELIEKLEAMGIND